MKELRPEQLFHRYDPSALGFETTETVERLTETVGQPRAVEAVRFGTGIARPGYNVFAFGVEGTGRHTLVRHQLERRANARPTPPDLCYVQNFADAHKPRLLDLPAGTGVALRRDMESLVEELRTAIEGAFESEEYHARRDALEAEFKERPEKELRDIAGRAAAEGLALLRTPGGLAMAPTRPDGEVMSKEELEQLSEEAQQRLESNVEMFQEEVQRTLRQMPKWTREHNHSLRQLNREFTELAVGHLMDEMREKYGSMPEALVYLDEVRQDIIEHARELMQPEPSVAAMLLGGTPEAGDRSAILERYQVNVIVDHGGETGAPVVHEDHPTYDNLVGRVEHIARLGALVTDFRFIKAGALHRANGGYLILEAHKLLRNPFAYDALKRTLQSGQLRIESLGQALSLVSTVSLEPEPLPLDVQVVLIGEPLVYYLLSYFDPDFRELFKVAADFDERIEASDDLRGQYVRMMATIAHDEKLRPFHCTAVARLLEQSARLADDQGKLSGRIGRLADLLREADYWAAEDGRDTVAAAHVQRAIDSQIRRADRLRERILEEIERGTLLIDTEGAAVGQVNGLSVIALGSFAFGRPSRITARARLGSGRVIDIEREVELGGPSHSKGVMILSGYLGARYARDEPLSLSASLVFEQSYGGVDGDSASLAELVALLSAIADVPVRQALAVTGSVNQHGRVQAIGGVNEKIEGFFDTCRARGLTGDQGVLIPASNERHLMLRQDVIDAVNEGRFRVLAVETVDEAIEALTGEAAGERDAAGEFPPGTFNHRVEARLLALAEERRKYGTRGVGNGEPQEG